MKRDFQLMQWLDAHNYSEHVSASTIRTVTRFTASPKLFIATAGRARMLIYS